MTLAHFLLLLLLVEVGVILIWVIHLVQGLKEEVGGIEEEASALEMERIYRSVHDTLFRDASGDLLPLSSRPHRHHWQGRHLSLTPEIVVDVCEECRALRWSRGMEP